MSVINLRDDANIKDSLTINQVVQQRMAAGPQRTVIEIRDHDTGELIDVVHNKVLVSGAQSTACFQFGLSHIVELPTYNMELKLQNSEPPYTGDPENMPLVSLWCIGRSGSGPNGETLVVENTDRIKPVGDIIPFRYVRESADLDEDHRKIYFGRKVIPPEELNIDPFEEREYVPCCEECAHESTPECQAHCPRYQKWLISEAERKEAYDQLVAKREEEIANMENYIAYYFKAFDTEPMLHIRYLDGTEVLEEMYNVDADQQVEVYVQTRLAISRQDCREAFDRIIGWDDSYISTLSLVTGWYTSIEEPNVDDPTKTAIHRYYQDILPFSKLNFKSIDLSDLTKAVDFIYNVYY